MNKTIEVVAAVIHDGGKYYATQRGHGDLKGLFEFPGGKIEAGEDHEEALIREIKEELDVSITVGEFVTRVDYDYPTFHLVMYVYLATIDPGETVSLQEHLTARWLASDEFESVPWVPADLDILTFLD